MSTSVQEAAAVSQAQQSRSRLPPILGSLTFPVVALVVVYLVFAVSPAGRAVDLTAFAGRLDAGHQLHLLNVGLLDAITVTSAGIGLLGLVAVGLWRHRLSSAIRAVGAVVAATLSAELMKLTLPHVRYTDQVWSWAGGGSFPSGHTTIAASLSLALLAVSSASWRRRLVGPLMAWTVLTATATITMGWHLPSDVFGALAVAALWHRVTHVGDPSHVRLRDTVEWSWLTRARAWSSAAVWWSVATAVVLWGSRPAPARGETFTEVPTAAHLLALTAVALGVAIQFVASLHRKALPAAAHLVGPEAAT